MPTTTCPPAPPVCHHCRKRVPSRPRGLCRACHSQKRIRRQYPPTSPWGNRGVDWYGRFKLASQPTDAAPGSEAKILVMMRRYERREALFHPKDAPLAESQGG